MVYSDTLFTPNNAPKAKGSWCTLWIRICSQSFDSLMFCLTQLRAKPNQTGLAQNVATSSCC